MGEAKWRRDNPELARAAADKDRAGLIDCLKKKGMPTRVCEYDKGGQTDTRMIEARTLVNLEIGQRGNHTRQVAEAAAATFGNVAKHAGPGMILPYIAGYDDHPREIWDIPDAAAYVRLWARLAGIQGNSDLSLFHEAFGAFLAACGVFGPEAKRMMHYPPRVTEQ